MSLDFDYAYDTYMSQMPHEYYDEFSQAWIDSNFYNSTLFRIIEEEGFPFDGVYKEYKTHVDSVSDVSVNVMNIRDDYRKVIYKDCSHETHRGQKIKYNNNVYLCYESTSELQSIAKMKMIKCNNVLTFLNEDGKIIKEPVFIGYELTSTNSNVTKDTTIEQGRLVCLVQINDETKNFSINQRFLLNKRKAFKVTNFNDMNKEYTYDEDATMMTMYIEWSAILPDKDNLDLLIADYYDLDYKLLINSTDLSLAPSASGQLTAVVKLNDVTQTGIPLKWSTSDSNVITIDSSGNYQVVGSDGSTAVITCSIDSNDSVSDTINISIVDTPVLEKEIIINPSIKTRILQYTSLDISYGVYEGETLTSDVVTITPSGASASNYTLTYSSGKVTVANLLKSTTNLTLTFSSGTLTDKTIELILGGIM